MLSKTEEMLVSESIAQEPTIKSLALEVSRLRERMEDMEDLMDLRAAVERNAEATGTAWEDVKRELDLE